MPPSSRREESEDFLRGEGAWVVGAPSQPQEEDRVPRTAGACAVLQASLCWPEMCLARGTSLPRVRILVLK